MTACWLSGWLTDWTILSLLVEARVLESEICKHQRNPNIFGLFTRQGHCVKATATCPQFSCYMASLKTLCSLSRLLLEQKNADFWDVRPSGSFRTEVLEGCSVPIIRVTRIGELGTMLAVTSNQRTLRRNAMYYVTLTNEALSSWETSVLTRAVLRKTSQKTASFIVTSVKTSNITQP
jgi:hypothetical protein